MAISVEDYRTIEPQLQIYWFLSKTRVVSLAELAVKLSSLRTLVQALEEKIRSRFVYALAVKLSPFSNYIIMHLVDQHEMRIRLFWYNKY